MITDDKAMKAAAEAWINSTHDKGHTVELGLEAAILAFNNHIIARYKIHDIVAEWNRYSMAGSTTRENKQKQDIIDCVEELLGS